MLTTIFIGLFCSAVGTFLGNLGLLYLIGRRAQDAEKEHLARVQQAQTQIREKIKEQLKKQQEYIRMES